MIRKFGGTYEPICDGCGEELPEEYDFGDALDAIKAEGWKSVPPEQGNGCTWEHYCPECQARWMFND